MLQCERVSKRVELIWRACRHSDVLTNQDMAFVCRMTLARETSPLSCTNTGLVVVLLIVIHIVTVYGMLTAGSGIVGLSSFVYLLRKDMSRLDSYPS
jgi:hypothetical protein